MKKLLLFFLSIIFMPVLSAQEIIKAQNDHRQYKFIELENGIQAILVSDPKAQKAAAAIDVGVGSFEDPDGMAGLTHFLEHILFLGTEKYPDTNDYSNFLSQHGGYNNAYTSSVNTNYHFSVNYAYLDEALDRLSQFFISPLFSEEYIQKEINAVNAEHQKNLQFEFRRSYAVLQEISQKDHPFSKFATGNAQTLTAIPNIRKEVINFYKKYYYGSSLKIAVLGRESLIDLEKLVRTKFKNVPISSVDFDRYQGRVYKKEQLPFQVKIQSLKNIRSLQLIFEIDSVKKYFKEKPTYYIANLLGHEGDGSLFSYIKKKEWILSLSAGLAAEQINSDFFAINIELTSLGETKINEVVKALFDYLALVKKEGVNSWRFKEMQQIANLDFNFQDNLKPLDLVQLLSARLKDYPIENTLNAGWAFQNFSPKIIFKVLNQLTLDNFFLVHNSQNEIADFKEEKWYKTKYKIEKFTAEELSYWQKDSISASLKKFFLPLPNRFLLSKEPTLINANGDLDKINELYQKDKKYKVNYVQNTSFKVPKAKIILDLDLPQAYSSPKNALLTKIYVRLLEEGLNESLYAAYLLDYNLTINATTKGIQLVIEGYPEKLNLFFAGALNFDIATFSNTDFKIAKQKISEEWQNLDYSPAYRIAMYEFYQLTQKPFWYYQDYLKASEQVNFKSFTNFKKKIFDKMRINLFAFGNITDKQVAGLVTKLKKTFKFELAAQPKYKSILEIPANKNFVIQKKVNDVNSALVIAYSAEQRNLSTKVKMDLLSTMMKDDFYDFIRTKEQLGYLVWSSYGGLLDTNSFNFIVQSPSVKPQVIYQKVELFLNDFHKKLTLIKEEDFIKTLNNLTEVYKEKPDNFNSTSYFYYRAVQNEDYKIQLERALLQEVAKLDKDLFIKFYEKLFLADEAKKMAVQTFSNKLEISSEDLEKQSVIISNRDNFKKENNYNSINPANIFKWKELKFKVE